MPDPIVSADLLADAYRAAMAAGDRELSASVPEQKILQAIVATSVADSAQWLQTRVAGGGIAAQPLVSLAPLLQKGNVVGQGLQAARTGAVKQAKSLALGAIGAASMPVWFASLVTLVAGIFGLAQQAGASTGTAIATALVGGGPVLFALVRVIQSGPAVGNAISAAAGSLWDKAGNIGDEAAALFDREVGPVLTAMYRQQSVAPPPLPVVGDLRSSARTLLGFAYGFLAVCVIIFVLGAFNAFSAAMDSPICVPSDFQTC